jgi:hypothetical protein
MQLLPYFRPKNSFIVYICTIIWTIPTETNCFAIFFNFLLFGKQRPKLVNYTSSQTSLPRYWMVTNIRSWLQKSVNYTHLLLHGPTPRHGSFSDSFPHSIKKNPEFATASPSMRLWPLVLIPMAALV